MRHRLATRRLQPAFERLHGWSLAGMGIGSAVRAVGESGEARFVAHATRWAAGRRANPCCLDVGANLGEYARLLAAGLGPEARIDCFEPSAATFARLTAALASLPTCRPHQLALGAVDGEAVLHTVPGHSQLASLHGELGASVDEQVPVARLDTWAAAEGIDHIELLKIDVEGAELDVLRGAGDLLAGGAVDLVQFEFGRRNQLAGTRMEDLFDLLAGYRLHRLVLDGLHPLGDYHEGLELPYSATNYVAVRDGLAGWPRR